MDCQPQDDACMLQRAYDSYMQEIVEHDRIERSRIPLGNFNGKAYTFYKVGTGTVIVIAPADADDEDDGVQFLESSNEGDDRG